MQRAFVIIALKNEETVTGESTRTRAGEAVVFDCDGLLLDTEELWRRGEARLLAEYGREYTPEAEERLFGASVNSLGPILAELLDLPGRGEALAEELLARCWEEVAAGARACPGAVEIVRDLRASEKRRPIGVASNSPRALVEEALRVAGLGGAFDVVLGADDVRRPKPAADIYLLCCERLNATPSRSIALEDSPTGVAAARAAGLYTIGIPSVPEIELDADEVAGSLEDKSVRIALSLPPL